MGIHQPLATPAPAAPLGVEIAAFAASLDERDAMFWPALAAADGCEASLAELNAMLDAEDCYPFNPASLHSPGADGYPVAIEARDGEGSAPHALPGSAGL